MKKNSSLAVDKTGSAANAPPSDIRDENGRLRDRIEDAKRRVKELFQQLQQMLEQF